ncbi:hypothetical protein ACFLU6_10480 [Acidobacteriota bacterium]
MRVVKVLFVVLAGLLFPYIGWAGCSMIDVCRDVMDTVVVMRGGGVDMNISWKSDSEGSDLECYKVVRSQSPGTGSWSVVSTVSPKDKCGNETAEYEVSESDPGDSWTYAVQVWDSVGLVCTILDMGE